MLAILKECHRILRPGGEFSISVPNAKKYIESYLGNNELDQEQYCNEPVGLNFKFKIDYVNYIAYMGGEHKHLFDQDNLVGVLREAGFQKARARQFQSDLDPHYRQNNSIYAIAWK